MLETQDIQPGSSEYERVRQSSPHDALAWVRSLSIQEARLVPLMIFRPQAAREELKPVSTPTLDICCRHVVLKHSTYSSGIHNPIPYPNNPHWYATLMWASHPSVPQHTSGLAPVERMSVPLRALAMVVGLNKETRHLAHLSRGPGRDDGVG